MRECFVLNLYLEKEFAKVRTGAAAGVLFFIDMDDLKTINDTFGHSAGGHLALWLAARSRIPKTSPLFHERPLPIAAAISIGGLPDLEAAQSPPGDTCDAEPVRKLVGMASNERPNVYVDTSPAAMFPFATPQILVNATRDRIAPPIFAENYAAKAKLQGTDVRRVTVPDEGHVELIAPGTASWAAELAEIRRALGQPED